jgi:hypothetical protein
VGGKTQGSSKTRAEKDQCPAHHESSRPEAHIGDGEEKVGGEA